ncbi:MAG: UvrB/UvrC motif-containing protein [Synergistaceae bacterium]|jgi:protein arginine kinase activator|nr:UvrB/UvrC motif-containing protein [Synergistaceae bacterium]
MLCSNCGKREVEVLIKQVVNQEIHNLSLCRVCAEELGFITPDSPSITISFSLNDPEVHNQRKVKRLQHSEKKNMLMHDSLVCSSCGLEYRAFRESGTLGCPGCYETFRFPLGAWLQKEQGAESHWDRMSGMFDGLGVVEDRWDVLNGCKIRDELRSNIVRLKLELEDAVSREDYERAAQLRDDLAPLLLSDDDEKDID